MNNPGESYFSSVFVKLRSRSQVRSQVRYQVRSRSGPRSGPGLVLGQVQKVQGPKTWTWALD